MASGEVKAGINTLDPLHLAPPGSALVVATFADDSKIKELIEVANTWPPGKADIKIFRLAVLAMDGNRPVVVRDIRRAEAESIGIGALIGGLAGLTAGPLGGAIGAGAGAVLGWSAERVNEDAVSRFLNDRDWHELDSDQLALVAEVAEDDASAFVALMQASGAIRIQSSADASSSLETGARS